MASRQLILALVATDSTFQRATVHGHAMWRGRCVHCRTPLAVALDGEPIGDVTIEHIVPRSHGGADDLDNLALSCGPCNHAKGRREDRRRRTDPALVAMIECVQAERRRRWRPPPE